MDWDNYCLEFQRQAYKAGKSREYCDKWLQYAHKLAARGLPVIYDQKHLCQLVGYRQEYVYAVSNAQEHFYRRYSIPKKNGGSREISEPLPSLKEIQRWILDNILEKVKISVYAKAYVKGKSIRENARFHKKQKILLSLDIEKFFDNIKSERVYHVFRDLGYAENVVVMLTNLCCLDGCLPQGAPTSPALSNIILTGFDDQIGNYIKDKKIRYTRYADDMTFSGDFYPGKIIGFVRRKLDPLGLSLNNEKIRTRRQSQRQEVTGVVVNEKMQLPKSLRKRIRQEMYYIRKYGLESHQQYCEMTKSNYLEHLRGIIQYGLFINPGDRELRSYIDFLQETYGESI